MDLYVATWPMLVLALIVFGFAPGLVLRLIVFAFHKDDPRRHELRGELYHVPRFERPFWVMEQLEVALVEGLGQRLVWAVTGRIIYRWHLGSGVGLNREYPDTFWIPPEEERDEVVPGMQVKLAFEMRDGWGERMWVTVTALKGHTLIGELDSIPAAIPGLLQGDLIEFEREHIIDIWYAHEGEAEICPGHGTPEHPDPVITKDAYNGHTRYHEVAADARYGHLPIEAPRPSTSAPPSSS